MRFPTMEDIKCLVAIGLNTDVCLKADPSLLMLTSLPSYGYPRNLKHHSSSHFSHFLTYLSSSCERSRMTKVKTTLAKNSDIRFSFCSAEARISTGKAAYDCERGCEVAALECSSSSCTSKNSFLSPRTY